MRLSRVLLAFLFFAQTVLAAPRGPSPPNTVPVENSQFNGVKVGDNMVVQPVDGEAYYGTYRGFKMVDGWKVHTVDPIDTMVELNVGNPRIEGSAGGPVRYPETNSGNVARGNSGAGSAPGGNSNDGSGNGFGDGVGSSIAAGVAAGAIRGIYNAFVMPPELEKQLKQGQENLNRAQAGQRDATQDYNKGVQGAGHQAARAVEKVAVVLSQPPQPLSKPNLTNRTEAGPRAFSTKDPRFRALAEPISDRLDKFKPRTQPEKDIKEIGEAAVDAASDSWNQGEEEVARTQLSIGTQMADLLVGLDPITGFARSGYEAYTGVNYFTGEKLANWERMMSGAVFGASLVTGGLAASGVNSVKAMGGILSKLSPQKIQKAVQAFVGARELMGNLKVLGWSDRNIAKFANFQKNVLGGEFRNFDKAVQAFKTWSPEAKATFRKTFNAVKGTSQELAEEAVKFGVSVETLLERKATAVGFYNNVGKFTGDAGEIAKHLKGIDFADDVVIKTIPKGTTLYSWANPFRHGSKPGNYFAETIMHPSKLGIGDLVVTELPKLDGAGNVIKDATGKVVTESVAFTKELRVYQVQKDTTVLSSVANEMADNFSAGKNAPWAGWARDMAPGSAIPGMQWTPGLGEQLFMNPENLKWIK